MDTNNTEISITTIKYSLETLGFPLLGEVRKFEDGYEIVINLESKNRIAKHTLRKMIESKNLSVSIIDVFTDSCGHYAYAVVNPVMGREVCNG